MRTNPIAMSVVLIMGTFVWGQDPEPSLIDVMTAPRVPFKYITTSDGDQFKLEAAQLKGNLLQVRGLLLTSNDVAYPLEGCLNFGSDNHTHFRFIRKAAARYDRDLLVNYPALYDVMIHDVYSCEVILGEAGAQASRPVFEAAMTSALGTAIHAALIFPEPRTLAQLAVDAAIMAAAPPVKLNRLQQLAVKAVVKALAMISKVTNTKKLAKAAKQLAKLQAKLEKLLPTPTIPVEPTPEEPVPTDPEEPAVQIADYLMAGQYSLVEMPASIPSMEYDLDVFEAEDGLVPFNGLRTTRYFGSMGSTRSNMYSVFGQMKLNGASGNVRYIEKFEKPLLILAQDFDVTDAYVVKTTVEVHASGTVYLTKSSVVTEFSAALKAAYRTALGISLN